MDSLSGGDTYLCGCGQSFNGPGPLNLHKCTCQPSKKCLHAALAKAKGLWEDRKRLYLESNTSEALLIVATITHSEGNSIGLLDLESVYQIFPLGTCLT